MKHLIEIVDNRNEKVGLDIDAEDTEDGTLITRSTERLLVANTNGKPNKFKKILLDWIFKKRNRRGEVGERKFNELQNAICRQDFKKKIRN